MSRTFIIIYYVYLAIGNMTSDATKYCKRCKTSRRISDFVRKWGQQMKEFSVCNICSLNVKKNRSGSSSITIEQNTVTLDSKEIGQSDVEIENEANNENDYDGLVYNIRDIEAAIKDEFINNDDRPISFDLEVELDDEISDVNYTSLTTVNQDLNLVAREIAKHLQMHVERGSEYY